MISRPALSGNAAKEASERSRRDSREPPWKARGKVGRIRRVQEAGRRERKATLRVNFDLENFYADQLRGGN